MDWLSTLVGGTRARLLRLVRSAARSINDLAEALSITDNAVRTHVTALERDGLIRQAGEVRATGGKPARLYELTPAAEELFPKAYAVAFTELVRTLKDEMGDDAARDLLRRVGHRLANAGANGHGDEASRIAAAVSRLEAMGGSVECERDDEGWVLKASGCPLSGVVAADPDACVLAESLVSAVTGLPVTEICDRSERPRCAFRVAAPVPAECRPGSGQP